MDKSETYKAIASRLGMAASAGVKAVMGKHWVESIAEKNRIITEYQQAKLNRQNAVRENASLRARGKPGKPIPELPDEPLFPFAFDAKTGEYEGLILGNERDVPTGCIVKWKTHASRPGAKAVMAQDWSGKRVTTDAGRMFIVQRSANGYDLYAVDTGKKAKSMTQQQMDEADRRGKFRDVFAVREGDKVSASDDAVSRKIRKLMDEGKPQKQAVAIALDLQRRGEL